MNFVAVFLALVVEQLKPLRRDNFVYDSLLSWMSWAGRNFDAGGNHHAWVVWAITVGAPALAVAIVYQVLAGQHVLLGLAFDVAVLYLTLGFRQFSHYFTQIRDAIERGDEIAARQHFQTWRFFSAEAMPRQELLRTVLEHALLAAHRHVFGVFFWFVLLSTAGLGPAGAVFYRLAEFAARYWTFKQRTTEGGPHERLMTLSQRAFSVIDFIPARLTAFGFAVVGNFEEAINGWRRDAELWVHSNEGVLLAAASGALGVRFGGRVAGVAGDAAGQGVLFDDPLLSRGSTPGMVARTAHLQSVVGLVWRSVVLWMLLLALLTLANVLG